jgi:uncharacterized membrane protein
MLVIVALGLTAALVYGASDFLGGYAARHQPSLAVTFVAFIAGMLASGLCLPLVASRWSIAALLYGAIAGLAAAGSIWLLYTALAIGPMSTLAPLIAVLAALLPVLYGLLYHARLGMLGDAALGAVLLFSSWLPARRESARALLAAASPSAVARSACAAASARVVIACASASARSRTACASAWTSVVLR